MPFPNNRFNPVVPTKATAVLNDFLVLSTDPLNQVAVTDRFILALDQVASIPYGNTDQAEIDDGGSTSVQLYDRYGGFVRADRLYQALRDRRYGLLPSMCGRVNWFQCVVGTDPIRVNILDCLPPSNYVRPAPAPSGNSSASSQEA